MALVSIIIPAFNAEPYISECLSSVLAQDFSNIEVFVVDDCSTDATGQIVREFAVADPRLHYVALSCNRGVMEARAMGVRSCNGDFVGFVDADDWIDPSMISSMLRRLQIDGSDIAVCGVAYVDENGQAKKPFRFKKDGLLIDGLRQFARRELGSAYLGNKLYRRETILSDATHNYGVRLKLGEDILVNFGAFARARSVSLMSDVFYMYRQNRHGATGGASKAEAFSNLFLAYSLCLAHFSDRGAELIEYVDLFFRVQFNFRCYRVKSALELEPHRERLSLALRLLADKQPEAVLYLMNVLKRREWPSGVFGSVLQRVFK